MHFRLLTQRKTAEEFSEYTAYGIEAAEQNQIISQIEDISTDKEKMLWLIEKFNNEKPELSHMEQMIEDFLYDFEV
ncbi:MAG: hypothetical protein IJV48_08545 [Ruminococcus sp.]|nr:hypothetical protein [Ruminococcus sp.]